jgi:GT2 family glycosyltransferase
VYVVLLNWNGWQDTLECVRSLQKLVYPRYSVVIVDNGSAAQDVQRLRDELGDSVHIIANPRNDGYCEGNNIGMRYALARGADYVLVLNNDTIVAPDFLSHLVISAEADDRVGIVVPRIFLYDQPETMAYPRGIDRWPLMLSVLVGPFFQSLKIPRLETPSDIRYLDGCCFLAKREVLEQTGLFDADYFFPGGAADVGKLTMDLGYCIMAVPEAVIWAKVARSFGDRRRGALAYAYWGPRSEILFARKHFARPQMMAFLVLFPLRTALWLLAWGSRVRTPAVLGAVTRGVRDGWRFPITHWPPRGGTGRAARLLSNLSRR